MLKRLWEPKKGQCDTTGSFPLSRLDGIGMQRGPVCGDEDTRDSD